MNPVVLLHGLATSALRTWVETGWVDLLRDEGREVIAPDLPGHGGAPPIDDWDRLEEHVAAQLPTGPLDAVGFSLGARVLLALAGREPERFGSLVVAGVGANLFRDDERGSFADELASPDSETDRMAAHFLQLAGSSATDPAAVGALVRRRSPDLDELLPRITARTLVVLGDQDFAGPADPLLERLPGAKFVPLRGVDHFATPKSMAFLDAALKFLG